MAGTASVLVVQPDPIVTAGRLHDLLAARGVTLRVVRPYAGEALPRDLEDGVLVLGGRMSAYHDAEHPWLEGVRRLLRHAVGAGRPVLGICLGGQLLAQALGGSVRRGDHGVECGVVEVRWRPEAQTDPLFAGLPQPFVTATWHGDMIDRLPDGAAWAGSTAQYPHQAFRVGPAAWGVQFHPEVSPSTLRGWLAQDGVTAPLAQPAQLLVSQFERRDREVAAASAALAARFASLVRTGAPQGPATAGRAAPARSVQAS